MNLHRDNQPTGVQIAFLIFAVVFLAYPMHKYAGPWLGLHDPAEKIAARLFIFVPALACLLLIPAVRRFCADQLRQPIRHDRRVELATVTFVKVLVPFAIAGAIVLWHWSLGGEMRLASRIGRETPVEAQVAEALTLHGAIFALVVAGLLAPLVEELVFRGLLYRAWEAQWGWFGSMIATSVMFGLYHPVPFAAFVGSMIFTIVMLRTGSIWSAILVHAVGNIVLWPPLMGQFYFRTAGKATGEIADWWPHLVALALLAIALPLYAWMARDRREDPAEEYDVAANARC